MRCTRRHVVITRRSGFRLPLAAMLAGTGFAAQAQSAAPLVGVLNYGSELSLERNLAAFRAGMTALGHVEGVTYRLELRASAGVVARLPDLAAQLVRDKPAV